MKYIRDRLRSILQFKESPHRLALASSVGVFIAFSPTFGLHTITCFLLAWIFRLSKIVVLTAALINNPWTIVPLYGSCLWFGIKITGSNAVTTPDIAWQTLTVTSAYHVVRPYLWPFIAGTIVVGAAAALISYFFIYWVVVRYRRGETVDTHLDAA
jgi:uncharacterized protein (DUF2062 family)